MEFSPATRDGRLNTVFASPGWLLLCALVYFACVTASNSWSDILLLTVLLGLGSLLLKVKPAVYLRAVKSSWSLIVFAVVFHLAFSFWFPSEQGQRLVPALWHTSFFVSRLLLLIGMTFVLLRVFTPAEYAESVASRLTLVLGKRTAGHASHIVMMSFSMLPQIQEHMSQRKLARKLRGISAASGIGGRLEYARSELSAALHYALDYSNVLAIVLWSRGFESTRALHLTKRHKMRSAWIVAAIGFCILCLTTLLP